MWLDRWSVEHGFITNSVGSRRSYRAEVQFKSSQCRVFHRMNCRAENGVLRSVEDERKFFVVQINRQLASGDDTSGRSQSGFTQREVHDLPIVQPNFENAIYLSRQRGVGQGDSGRLLCERGGGGTDGNQSERGQGQGAIGKKFSARVQG